MARSTWVFAAVLATGVGLSSVMATLAQQPAEADPLKTTPLGVRQARVERMVEDLERKFNQLAQALAKAEPERAQRLADALKQAQALGIKGRMAAITRLLDQQQLDPAKAEETKILGDLKDLLALLLDEKNDKDKNREEFERLSEWKKQIEEVIQQQKGEKREADKVANKDDTLKSLEAKIKAIEALVEQQKGVISGTEAARDKGIQGLGKIAGEQAKVREGTQAVTEQIAKEAGDKSAAEAKPGEANPGEGKPGEGKPGEGKPSEGKPGEAKPGEGKPGEGKPGEGKPGEGKPGEGKPGEGKPGEGKPGEGKLGEGKPGEGKPGEGQPGGEQPQRPQEAGERPLKQAIQNQQQAEAKLQDGKGKAAQQDEQAALENLQRALGELKKEQQRIASLPPEAFEKMAGKQDDIANQTGKIQEKMEKGEQGGGQPGGGQPGGGGEAGKPKPGQQKVQQAQKSMQQASGDLRKQDPADASRQQGKAIKDLEEALREIEERLAQLREETQVEKLAKLEARFREMLATQKELSARVLVLDKKKADSMGQLARSDRNALKSFGEDERGLAIIKQEGQPDRVPLAFKAQQALEIILDDGTSVVFPDVVEQLRDDLVTVGGLLADNLRTDNYTQAMQKEVETTLEELIEALQKSSEAKRRWRRRRWWRRWRQRTAPAELCGIETPSRSPVARQSPHGFARSGSSGNGRVRQCS